MTGAWAAVLTMGTGTHGQKTPRAFGLYIDAARVVYASIRRFEIPSRRRPFYMFMDSRTARKYGSILQDIGFKLFVQESPCVLPLQYWGNRSELRHGCGGDVGSMTAALRLEVFARSGIERIVLVDLDIVIIAPLEHLFNVPDGVSLVATMNGTRWKHRHLYQDRSDGYPRINSGIMSLSGAADLKTLVKQVIDYKHWERSEDLLTCSRPLDPESGAIQKICAYGLGLEFADQGVIDGLFSIMGRRLGDAVWSRGMDKFLGCLSLEDASGQEMVMPRHGEHCTLDESHNLQVTRPHLQWHMPFLSRLGQMGGLDDVVRIVHWPGWPKPWNLEIGQRSFWERLWWDRHGEVCGDCSPSSARPCWIRC